MAEIKKLLNLREKLNKISLSRMFSSYISNLSIMFPITLYILGGNPPDEFFKRKKGILMRYQV
jgi:hypothetical protein